MLIAELPVVSSRIGNVAIDVDKITALLESTLGPLRKPITHFHCLTDPFGRTFLQKAIYDACTFYTPIPSWKALAQELARIHRETRFHVSPDDHEGQEMGWEINRLDVGPDKTEVAISVYRTWI